MAQLPTLTISRLTCKCAGLLFLYPMLRQETFNTPNTGALMDESDNLDSSIPAELPDEQKNPAPVARCKGGASRALSTYVPDDQV